MAATDTTVCQTQTSYRKVFGLSLIMAYAVQYVLNLLIWMMGFIPSWLMSWFRWIPTSAPELQLAEEKVLSFLKIPYRTFKVNVGKGNKWTEDNYVQTITMNNEGDNDGRLPIVMIHGFCSGIALWSLNLDSFASNRAVYALDLLGFGRSSRPRFSSVALEAEHQFVQSIEDWREQVGLDQFILLGHSMGGYLAASYALQHPQRVAHLILADPWGFPEKPVANHAYEIPIWVKAIGVLLGPFNALAGLRAAGPWGPKLIDRLRPDLRKKFEPLIEDSTAINDYIYHCNAQTPSGESAFKALTFKFGWAKHPMINRIPELRSDVPITFIYGSRSWIDRQPGINLKFMRPNSYVDVQVIQGAGHHVYADRGNQFNNIVNAACSRVDVLQLQKTEVFSDPELSPTSISPVHISIESKDTEAKPSSNDSQNKPIKNIIQELDPERIS